MTDNPKHLEAMNAEELWNAYCGTNPLERGMEIVREMCARLRERDAARKVAHDYQSQEVKVTLTNTYFVGVHLEDALDTARKQIMEALK